MARIDWSEASDVVARHIRSYDPKPGAFTTHRDAEIKLFDAAVATEADHGTSAPGTVVTIDAQGMLVACGTGTVRVACAQPAGRTRIDPAEWMRGRGIDVGERLGG
jgi:methionyl-tRNA formyltransferase